MRDYGLMLSQKAEMINPEEIARDIQEVDNWVDAYHIGQFICEQGGGEENRLMMDAYEKAFDLGLTVHTNRDCFLLATQQSAKTYFHFKRYEEAINKLMILVSNYKDLPDWVNLYFATAQIHTDSIVNIAEEPSLFFKRIDSIDEKNVDSIKRRKYLFLEFLNRLSEKLERKELKLVNDEAILEKAKQLGVEDSKACLNFKIALGIVPTPTLSEALESGIEACDAANRDADLEIESREQLLMEVNRRLSNISELIAENESLIGAEEDILNDYESEIQNGNALLEAIKVQMESMRKISDTPNTSDIYDVGKYLERRQKILIIGGTEVKEKDLRGKLKSMGFNFSKEQLEFELEYDNVKEYAAHILPWVGKYAGIIVGPCPHKAKDTEGYSSFVEKIKSEEGYPHVEEAYDRPGHLKLTKNSVGNAMERMATYLVSIC